MKKIIIMFMVLLAVGSVQAQLLINGGFDDGPLGQTGMVGGVAVPGWTVWGYDSIANMGWIHDNPDRVQSGQGVALAWDTTYFIQDFNFGTMVEGQEYTYSIDVKDTTGAAGYPADDADGWNGFLKAEIWDYDGVAWYIAEQSIVEYDFATDPEDQWITLSTSLTAPAATSEFQLGKFTFGLRFVGPAFAGTLDFDNASVVPEPATMALLGLGGLLLRRKK